MPFAGRCDASEGFFWGSAETAALTRTTQATTPPSKLLSTFLESKSLSVETQLPLLAACSACSLFLGHLSDYTGIHNDHAAQASDRFRAHTASKWRATARLHLLACVLSAQLQCSARSSHYNVSMQFLTRHRLRIAVPLALILLVSVTVFVLSRHQDIRSRSAQGCLGNKWRRSSAAGAGVAQVRWRRSLGKRDSLDLGGSVLAGML